MTDDLERWNSRRKEAMGDLRAYLRIVEENGELEVVDGADAHLEMGALYELSLRKRHPPVLLFQNIKGYSPDYRMLTNVRFARTMVGAL